MTNISSAPAYWPIPLLSPDLERVHLRNCKSMTMSNLQSLARGWQGHVLYSHLTKDANWSECQAMSLYTVAQNAFAGRQLEMSHRLPIPINGLVSTPVALEVPEQSLTSEISRHP